MVITLYTKEIMDHLRSISHREVAAIDDPDARYRVEAGTEKTYEINRCVSEAISRLSTRCRRWLKSEYQHTAGDTITIPTQFDFNLVLSERRSSNNAEPLQSEMHTFAVEYALSKFYSIVNQGELSNKHSLLAIDAGNTIDQILYTKQPPRV